jgi:hypothetical protein
MIIALHGGWDTHSSALGLQTQQDLPWGRAWNHVWKPSQTLTSMGDWCELHLWLFRALKKLT